MDTTFDMIWQEVGENGSASAMTKARPEITWNSQTWPSGVDETKKSEYRNLLSNLQRSLLKISHFQKKNRRLNDTIIINENQEETELEEGETWSYHQKIIQLNVARIWCSKVTDGVFFFPSESCLSVVANSYNFSGHSDGRLHGRLVRTLAWESRGHGFRSRSAPYLFVFSNCSVLI